jgi:HAE1 family hydrophobic/amphiphilic exporter-1
MWHPFTQEERTTTNKGRMMIRKTSEFMNKFVLSVGLIGIICVTGAAQDETNSATSQNRQGIKSSSSRPLPDAGRIGVDVTEQINISLKDAVERAFDNNNDIDNVRLGRRIADLSLKGSRGGFDPLFFSESFLETRSIPTASIIGGARNGLVSIDTLNSNIGISGLSGLLGGRYSVVFNSAKTNTSNQNATLNPQFPTSIAINYTQPLLAGRFDSTTRSLRIAKRNVELSDSQFKLRAIDVVSQVEQSYWDLIFSLRNLQVQIDALKQARLQLESNERLVERGVIAPIEIVAANAQISNLEQNVFAAQAGVTSAENRLKSLILPDRTDPLWNKAIVPISAGDPEIPRMPLNEALRSAFENRQELNQVGTASEINKINEDYFRNQTRPRVDLTGTYIGSGLAGSTTPQSINPSTGELRIPEGLIGGYRTSLGNLFGNDYPTYRVGLTISLPLRNRQAEADLGRTLVEGDVLRNSRAQLEQVIESEVRNSLQNLRSAEARLEAAIASRVSAELLYESEQRQFRAGTTTVYLVFQRQNDLIAAKGREVQAQTDLNKAISIFKRSIGSTLEANGIETK